MKTSPVKKYSLLLVLLITLSLVCIAGTIFLFARMYQHDIQALTDFIASYQAYDRAVAAASASVFTTNGIIASYMDANEHQADVALSNLKITSTVQISSLIKNEKEAMSTMGKIADLSDQEMRTLKAYQQAAGQDENRNGLAQAFQDLMKERQAAFAHFQELGR